MSFFKTLQDETLKGLGYLGEKLGILLLPWQRRMVRNGFILKQNEL